MAYVDMVWNEVLGREEPMPEWMSGGARRWTDPLSINGGDFGRKEDAEQIKKLAEADPKTWGVVSSLYDGLSDWVSRSGVNFKTKGQSVEGNLAKLALTLYKGGVSDLSQIEYVSPDEVRDRSTGRVIKLEGNRIGKGKAVFKAQQLPDGGVAILPGWKNTSDVGKIAPVVGGLLAMTGIGAPLGAALGATGAGASALGGALIGGGINKAAGGDFLRGAIAGGLGGYFGAGAGAGGGSVSGGAASGATGGGSLLGGPLPTIGAPSGNVFAAGALGPGTAGPISAAGASSIKEALFGAAGYGPGMTGAATSAFDSVLGLTGSTDLAALAGNAANAAGSVGSWVSSAFDKVASLGGGGALSSLFGGSSMLRDVLGLVGSGVQQYNVEKRDRDNRNWQSNERQKERDFELQKEADRRARQAPVTNNLFGRAVVIPGGGNGG